MELATQHPESPPAAACKTFGGNCDGTLVQRPGETISTCDKCGYRVYVCPGEKGAGQTGRLVAPPLRFGVVNFASRLVARFEDEGEADLYAGMIGGSVCRV